MSAEYSKVRNFSLPSFLLGSFAAQMEGESLESLLLAPPLLIGDII